LESLLFSCELWRESAASGVGAENGFRYGGAGREGQSGETGSLGRAGFGEDGSKMGVPAAVRNEVRRDNPVKMVKERCVMGIQERDKLGKGSRRAYKKGMAWDCPGRGKCERPLFSPPLPSSHPDPGDGVEDSGTAVKVPLRLVHPPGPLRFTRLGGRGGTVCSKHEQTVSCLGIVERCHFETGRERLGGFGSDRGVPACWSLLVPVPQQRSSRHARAPGSVLCPGVAMSACAWRVSPQLQLRGGCR